MQLSHGVLLVTLFVSNTNGLPVNMQYFCNYDYSTMWSGNHILLGNILGRINQPKRCGYFMTTDTSIPTAVTTTSSNNFETSFGTTSSEALPTKNPKLAQKKIKVCKTTFNKIPIMSLSNMMRFNRFYKPVTKCHWIDIESEEITISTTAAPYSSTTLTFQPQTTRSRPILFKLLH